MGRADDADVMRVVDWAVEEGLADERRIGLLGLSYGGYLTNWLLGHHPGRFAAAVSENPVTDWLGMIGGSDIGVVVQTDEFAGIGTLPEHLDEAIRRSPWAEIHRNEAPLLLLQSEQDQRCPPGQTELAVCRAALAWPAGQTVRYPGEPHYLLGHRAAGPEGGPDGARRRLVRAPPGRPGPGDEPSVARTASTRGCPLGTAGCRPDEASREGGAFMSVVSRSTARRAAAVSAVVALAMSISVGAQAARPPAAMLTGLGGLRSRPSSRWATWLAATDSRPSRTGSRSSAGATAVSTST